MEENHCCSSLEHSQICRAICKIGRSVCTHEATRRPPKRCKWCLVLEWFSENGQHITTSAKSEENKRQWV